MLPNDAGSRAWGTQGNAHPEGSRTRRDRLDSAWQSRGHTRPRRSWWKWTAPSTCPRRLRHTWPSQADWPRSSGDGGGDPPRGHVCRSRGTRRGSTTRSRRKASLKRGSSICRPPKCARARVPWVADAPTPSRPTTECRRTPWARTHRSGKGKGVHTAGAWPDSAAPYAGTFSPTTADGAAKRTWASIWAAEGASSGGAGSEQSSRRRRLRSIAPYYNNYYRERTNGHRLNARAQGSGRPRYTPSRSSARGATSTVARSIFSNTMTEPCDGDGALGPWHRG